jgi:hypothetical protein
MDSTKLEAEWKAIISPGYEVGDIVDYEFIRRMHRKYGKSAFPPHWAIALTDPTMNESDAEEVRRDARAQAAFKAKKYETGFTIHYIDCDTGDILNFELKEGRPIPSVFDAIENRTLAQKD